MSTTGNVFAGTGENNAGIGATAWTSPTSVTADDTTDATCNAAASSQYLVARNFDFSSVPADAVITGITVRIEASEHSASTESLNAQLQNESGTLVGSSQAQTISGTGKSVYTYGGSADAWGATLTPAIVKDADFGVRFWFTTAHDVRIDYVTMAVDYELPPTPETKFAAPQLTKAREVAGFAVAFIAAAAHIPAPPGTDTIGAANYSVGSHRSALAEGQPKPWVGKTAATLISAPVVADSPIGRIIVTIPQRGGQDSPQIWHAIIPDPVVGTDAIGAANYTLGTHQSAVASRQPRPSVSATPVALIPTATADTVAVRTVQPCTQASAYRASLFTRALIPSDSPVGRLFVVPPQRATDPQPALSRALIPDLVIGTDAIGSANYSVGTHRPSQIRPAIFRALIPAEVAEDRIFTRNYEADQQIPPQPPPFFARAKIDALPVHTPQPKTLLAGPQQPVLGSARVYGYTPGEVFTRYCQVYPQVVGQPQPSFTRAQIGTLPLDTPQLKTLRAGLETYQQAQPIFAKAKIEALPVDAPQARMLLAGLVIVQQAQPVFVRAQIEALPVATPSARVLYAHQQVWQQSSVAVFGRRIVETVADTPIARFVSVGAQPDQRVDSRIWHAQIADALVPRFVWTAPQQTGDGRGWVKSPAVEYQILGTDIAVGVFRFVDHRFVPIQYAITSRISVSWLEAGGSVTSFDALGWDDVFFEPNGFDITKFDAR